MTTTRNHKTSKTPTKRKVRTIMMSLKRYRLIVNAAKACGYKVGRGPHSQLGTFVCDAAMYRLKYGNSTKPLPLKKQSIL